MTHLRGKPKRQKQYIRNVLRRANNKTTYKIYRATEKITKHKHHKR